MPSNNRLLLEMLQNLKMAKRAWNVGSYFTTLVAVLATITEIATMAATLQHLYFALFDIMVIIDDKTILIKTILL